MEYTTVTIDNLGCGMWRSIKEGSEKFFGQIMYNVGEGCRVSFWHDLWSGPIPLKELFPAMFACTKSKEAWVSDLVVSTLVGGNDLEFTFPSWSSGLGGTHCLFLFWAYLFIYAKGVRGWSPRLEIDYVWGMWCVLFL